MVLEEQAERFSQRGEHAEAEEVGSLDALLELAERHGPAEKPPKGPVGGP